MLGSTLEKNIAAILHRCLNGGDRLAWESFIEHAQPSVASAVLRVMWRSGSRSREMADDLIQETFLKMCADDYRVLRSFRTGDPGALHVYLRTVAASVATDFFRSELTQRRGGGAQAASIEDIASHFQVKDAAFDQIERRALLDHVERCLRDEAPRNRLLFWLYHRDGLTPKAISGITSVGMSVSAIETAIYRLTRSIRDCLKRAGLLDSAKVREGGPA